MILDADVLMNNIADDELDTGMFNDRHESIDAFSGVRTLTVGEGTNVIRADRDGFWVGASNSGMAPFKVSPNGRTCLLYTSPSPRD